LTKNKKYVIISFMTTFKELGLNSDITKGLKDLGFSEPTQIQSEAIEFILKSSASPTSQGRKKDLIALAQTGTGKTAAFGLPILNQLKANERELLSIILCPTRELCLQISQDIKAYARHTKGVKVTPVYGGEKIDIQIRALKRGTNIVVGTPGRVHDLIRRKILKLQNIKWLVLDEADEMLDMGFKDDLDAILEQTPKTRQTLLFSATISTSVRMIAKQYMKEAETIRVGEQNVGAEKVAHEYYVVGARDRFEALKRILDSLPGVYGILFCRTRRETQEIADKLKQANYDTEALHGEISQNIRTKIMDRFKRKQIRLLVATDVAARGIDVSNLTHVINYNLPDQNEAYTHRSGRTGRADKHGISILILTPRDTRKIKDLERMIGKKFELKKVPNGKDVYKKQIDCFVEEIVNTEIKDIGDDIYFKEVSERLKKVNKEDLIKYFISDKFGYLINSYKNSGDLNVKAKIYERKIVDGNSVNLKVNFGKKNRFDIKGLFGMLNSNKNLLGIEVGNINIMLEQTIFSVEKSQADRVLKYLKGTNYRGKRVEIEKTSESATGSRRSTYKGKKNYNGKRSSGYLRKKRGKSDRRPGRNKRSSR
jgi:ATP-dependent RNA helicase DeaD